MFGQRRTPLPVVAAKSYFGNLGAASGLVELIASLLLPFKAKDSTKMPHTSPIVHS